MNPDNDDRKRSDARPGGAQDGAGGKTRYDKPATPDEDTATDERRDKPIRGPEPHERD